MNLPDFETIEIPDKRSFKIGEVAKLLDLEPYVLRYWEKEFDVLEPNKTESGQRSYERDDIQLLATIRELLYTEMFTIDGARRQLQRVREGEPSYLDQSAESGPEVEALREENQELEAEVDELDERVASYEEHVDELESELERARSESTTDAELEEENERLRRELQEARSQIEDLEARCRGLEQEASNRPGILDDLRTEISELAAAAEGGRRPRA